MLNLIAADHKKDACATCPMARKIERQAARILDSIIRSSHVTSEVLVVELTDDEMLELFLWRSDCEECESGEEYGDGSEPWIPEDMLEDAA